MDVHREFTFIDRGPTNLRQLRRPIHPAIIVRTFGNLAVQLAPIFGG